MGAIESRFAATVSDGKRCRSGWRFRRHPRVRGEGRVGSSVNVDAVMRYPPGDRNDKSRLEAGRPDEGREGRLRRRNSPWPVRKACPGMLHTSPLERRSRAACPVLTTKVVSCREARARVLVPSQPTQLARLVIPRQLLWSLQRHTVELFQLRTVSLYGPPLPKRSARDAHSAPLGCSRLFFPAERSTPSFVDWRTKWTPFAPNDGPDCEASGGGG